MRSSRYRAPSYLAYQPRWKRERRSVFPRFLLTAALLAGLGWWVGDSHRCLDGCPAGADHEDTPVVIALR